MNILRILYILNGVTVDNKGRKPREILTDFPGCGQLGNVSKKECIWNCDWQNSTMDGLTAGQIEVKMDTAVKDLGDQNEKLLDLIFLI